MTSASAARPTATTEDPNTPLHRRTALLEICLVFLAAGVILFLFSGRNLLIFDEGILLTDVMRTMHGQVLHRDFNYNYGPAQLYMLAGLFKLFGPSVLVDRLAAVVSNSVLAVSLYILTRRFCGRALALSAACLSVLWSIGLAMTVSAMNALLCTLTFWTSWLILPVSSERLQRRRALWAGFLAAVMFLYRYDIGVSIAGANLAAVFAMMWLAPRVSRRPLQRVLVTIIGPYIAAFIATVLPFAVAYLSVAPLHDLLYDVVIYMAKYYRLGRGLPLPIPRFGPKFDETAVYLIPILGVLALWMAARWRFTSRRSKSPTETPTWLNLLVAVGVAAVLLCMKGLVRVSVGGMYGSVIACVLIAALLLSHTDLLGPWHRGLLTLTVTLFVLTALSAAHGAVASGPHLKALALNRILMPNRQPPFPPLQRWCHDPTPITRGFCYLLDDDHIQAVEFLHANTGPSDYLFVGVDGHDRIIANDMITYFAVQRLPAVKWAEFDPFLQNRADIQQDMIADLNRHRPPYVMLDSEFDKMWEPNGSSVHTGVHLLDDYIADHYKPVQQYGELTILERQK